eukprot:TRINITY_DN383_c2_g2_i1.p2 TRINITY_DN383_c2_g2~~TRINITY_DN383_c2_g2_i1.p2  ORF type:complete len:367 (-),score=120.77 TRINITY_DN383_c2_g2_i1:259-1359(-)
MKKPMKKSNDETKNHIKQQISIQNCESGMHDNITGTSNHAGSGCFKGKKFLEFIIFKLKKRTFPFITMAPKSKKKYGGPKRPSTSYFLWCSSVREEMKKEHPEMKVTELSKVMGEKWRGMSDEDKIPFVEKAKTLKDAYLIEKKKYDDEHPAEIEEQETSKKSTKKRKKDPNAPKKTKSAYIFFSMRCREILKEEGSVIKGKEILPEIGRRWAALSAEEKKEFEEKSAEDKKRYEEDMKTYTPPENEDEDVVEAPKKKRAVQKKKAKQDAVDEPEPAEDDDDTERSASRFRKYCRGYGLKKLYEDLELNDSENFALLCSRLEANHRGIKGLVPNSEEIIAARNYRDSNAEKENVEEDKILEYRRNE